jgi:hypothetical protein
MSVLDSAQPHKYKMPRRTHHAVPDERAAQLSDARAAVRGVLHKAPAAGDEELLQGAEVLLIGVVVDVSQ